MIFYIVHLFHKPTTGLGIYKDDSAVLLITVLDTMLGPSGKTSQKSKVM